MNSGIDLLRHIFAVAVIAQHMTSASRYSVETNMELARVVNWIDGAVIGFFLISGYLFKSQSNIFNYCKRQAVRLLAPFFVFSIIYLFILAALGKENFIDGLVQIGFLHGVGMQLYFLPYLLIITVVFAFLERRLRFNRWILLCLLTIFAGGVAFLMPTASSTGSDIGLIPMYFCAFLAGHLIAEREKRKLHVQTMLLIGALSLMAGIKDERFFDFAGIVIVFGMTLLLSPLLPKKRLSGSGGVYLLHTPITNFAVSTVLAILSITQSINIIASIFLTYFLCLAITLIAIKKFPRYSWLILE